MTEAYLQPPHVVVDPGPEYGDDTRRFQGIPGIERAPGGRLWATWYGGTGPSEDRHNHVLLATSADDGETWSAPCTIIDPDGAGPVRAYDPCLWTAHDGRLWWFWAQGYERHTDATAGVWAMTTDEPDAARPTWSAPRRLCDGIMMNRPLVTTWGDWLLPAAHWRTEGSAAVVASTDGGVTWVPRGAASVPEAARSCDEHMLVERTGGILWLLVRTTYGIGESLSDDGGCTWSPVTPAPLGHPTTRFFVRRLQSGRLLLVKHGPLYRRLSTRSHLTAYLSDDDGHSWEGGLLLDDREAVSYPDAVQAPDGTIHLTYDFDRRGARQILHAAFTEGDVLRGATAAGNLRRLVNEAKS